MTAEPEEVRNRKGKAFVATLAIGDARRLGQNNHGSNASNVGMLNCIRLIPPHALEMGGFWIIS